LSIIVYIRFGLASLLPYVRFEAPNVSKIKNVAVASLQSPLGELTATCFPDLHMDLGEGPEERNVERMEKEKEGDGMLWA